MTAMCGVVSLAVDYARVQLVKTELQCAADGIARMSARSMSESQPDADVRYDAQAMASKMSADGSPIILTSSDVEFGYWDATAKTFAVRTTSYGANAMRITCQRVKSRSTAVARRHAGRFDCQLQ
jgi:Flp pilus assembly protein TadG